MATPKRSKKLFANCQELLTLGVKSAEFRAEGGIFRRWRIRRPPEADNQAENPYRYGGRLRNFELKVGFEPTTCGLRNRCSTAELLQPIQIWHFF